MTPLTRSFEPVPQFVAATRALHTQRHMPIVCLAQSTVVPRCTFSTGAPGGEHNVYLLENVSTGELVEEAKLVLKGDGSIEVHNNEGEEVFTWSAIKHVKAQKGGDEDEESTLVNYVLTTTDGDEFRFDGPAGVQDSLLPAAGGNSEAQQSSSTTESGDGDDLPMSDLYTQLQFKYKGKGRVPKHCQFLSDFLHKCTTEKHFKMGINLIQMYSRKNAEVNLYVTRSFVKAGARTGHLQTVLQALAPFAEPKGPCSRGR